MSDTSIDARIREYLHYLYGNEQGERCFVQLQQRMQVFAEQYPSFRQSRASEDRFSEDDVILITYADQVCSHDQSPLQTLADVLNTSFQQVVSTVHLLPFYPYTSDDGFSVVDYTVVDPASGSWEDIEALRADYRLMFDAVINHISASSAWFQAFLRGEAGAAEYFMLMDPATDLSQVTRPRALPLLTRFETPDGERYVWTTFSADQIDLNFANPQVLLDIIDVLLLYVAHGALLIRLDAIGYLWKEVGTRSIHLPQTHCVVQLFRAVLDVVAPEVALITETNVPHADNISYFGDGTNEAQLVYQFPLAPLVLHAFHSGSAYYLTEWASQLALPSKTTTFFNFLASHDGIGVVPATGILSTADIANLVARVDAYGGHVSSKTNADGSQSPYELNITLFDALSDPSDAQDSYEVDRFIAANAIMLALQGIPGIYVHSLVGSHNYHTGVRETERFRSINREKWERADIELRLADSSSHESQVFQRFADLITKRRGERAFHPSGPQHIINLHESLFTFVRVAPDGQERILCVHNVSDQIHAVLLDKQLWGGEANEQVHDIVTEATYQSDGSGTLALHVEPYQVLWLKPSND
ncbi:MAG: sugar phosphorylase [Chloroflexi bacterium AL-W]|nr:sugar phosphorylase [Chloroflexi bacterium AL-N1]NOK69024.1 sugar phosphorylase [Chloroflexi bacterium AL-N10]NOK77007.1 sugar phosphorylase [Chloroflexi bacterium AL-N5]NOK82605.1 sugar phosphorylase [Chloroflexi bacterium AL-W]NOK90864.1 sugar phosphorylase [Chloroflexi bacterium AL-N15]